MTKLKAAQKYVSAPSCKDTISNVCSDHTLNKGNLAIKGPAAAAVDNVQLPNLETDLMSPYDDGISGNPVGELQVKTIWRPEG